MYHSLLLYGTLKTFPFLLGFIEIHRKYMVLKRHWKDSWDTANLRIDAGHLLICSTWFQYPEKRLLNISWVSSKFNWEFFKDRNILKSLFYTSFIFYYTVVYFGKLKRKRKAWRSVFRMTVRPQKWVMLKHVNLSWQL